MVNATTVNKYKNKSIKNQTLLIGITGIQVWIIRLIKNMTPE